MQSGQLEAIWIKRMKFGPMDRVSSATLLAQKGIVGNANQGGKRQVTIIEQEVWQQLMQQMSSSLDPSARRANLLVNGVDLNNSRGKLLKIGSCRIRILGETRPCERMDEALPGLREAMKKNWGGGAFGEVLDNGEIKVGDKVCWADQEES
ncbi:MAG: MOSC domain-containing protein [Blastocatellia bacterium]|nr:MOSC domain-containing protein [Blastocatellia bacterium]